MSEDDAATGPDGTDGTPPDEQRGADWASTDGGSSEPVAVRGRLGSLASGVRFGKFASVGVVGATCDTLVLFVLAGVVGVLPELATVVGIETAIVVMFLLNDHWTFAEAGDAGRDSFLRRLLRSHMVRAAGSTTQFVVFVALFRGVEVTWPVAGYDLWLLGAKAGGIAVGMVVNYTFESLFTWRVHEDG